MNRHLRTPLRRRLEDHGDWVSLGAVVLAGAMGRSGGVEVASSVS